MHCFLKFIFGIKLYMFRTVPLSIIRSFFTVHTEMVYVILKFHKWAILICFLCLFGIHELDVQLTVHRDKFLQ